MTRVARCLLLAGAVVAIGLPAFSQDAPVRFVSEPKLFILDAEDSSYVVGINELNHLQHVHWGGRLLRTQDLQPARASTAFAFETRESLTPEEYPGWGGMRFAEPCLKVTFDDGVRDLVLRYDSHQILGDTLMVRLRDLSYELFVDVVYTIYPRYGILARHAVIQNRTSRPVTLESAQSAAWHLPAAPSYRLSHLAGRWGGETRLERELLGPGKKVIESRRGNTSHQANPWFAIDDGAAGEEQGRVWFGALAWSGNWRMAFERLPDTRLRIVGGFNDFDFGYRLAPGETLSTPVFYSGFTSRGFGDASRRFHQFQLREIFPSRSASRPRPVLYNSWEATQFDVNEENQKRLATQAARLGVELFVMDDGWFGRRDNNRDGLGDWFVNPTKFPNGLNPLIEHVRKLGMGFGLWVEPEMVNPPSDLYRDNPDWVVHFPGRPRSEGRRQLILNMARADVREHIFGVLDKLLGSHDFDFIKWDMNRHFSEPGWPQLPAAEQKKIWVEYVHNVYQVIDRLRAKYPKVDIEACSGGGGRLDLGILSRVEQVWTSDNTEAFDRLSIQEGFSFAYAPKAMVNWVTDVPNLNNRSTSLTYRFLVAMTGSLGIGNDLNRWSEEDFKLATRMVTLYKRIRPTVQHGLLYRLASPREGELTAIQYVSEDGRQVALFVFRRSQQFQLELPAVRLRGLDPKAIYRLDPLDGKTIDNQRELSGSYLEQRGLHFRLTGDFDATLVILDRVS